MATHKIYRNPLFLFFSLAFFCSCKIMLLSPYDEVTDKTVTEMQQKTSAFFVKHVADPTSSELTYQNQRGFYNDLRVKSATIRIRNSAIEKNRQMIGMIHQLDQNIQLMDSLHRIKPNGLLSPIDVGLLNNAFETQYTAMMKFILGLKARAKAHNN